MAYLYSGNTQQKGIAHANRVCAIKVDPAGTPQVEVLDSTTADVLGDFTLTWLEWAGRVIIAAFDDDETELLNCKAFDWLEGNDGFSRYAGFLELSPDFFYAMDESTGTFKNLVDPAADLKEAPGYSGVYDRRVFMNFFIGMPGVLFGGDNLLVENTPGTCNYNMTEKLTIGAIVKTGNDITTHQTIMSWGDEASTGDDANMTWALEIKSGRMRLTQQRAGGTYIYRENPFSSLSVNTEYQLVVTRDDGVNDTMTFFVDGVQKYSDTPSGSDKAAGGIDGKLAIGGRAGTTDYGFDGSIRCVFAKSGELSSSQVTKLFNQSVNFYSAIVLSFPEVFFYWPMDETSGQWSYDKTGQGTGRNGYHNRSINGTKPAPAGLGQTGIKFRADGGGTRYVTPSNNVIITENFTFGGWFRPVVQEYSASKLFGYYRSASNAFQMANVGLTNEHTCYVTSNGAAGVGHNSGVHGVLNVWEFLTWTVDIDTGEWIGYRNGQEAWRHTLSRPVHRADYYEVAVGAWDFGGNYYKGYICGCFHIDKKLAASEIAELYEAGVGTGRDEDMLAQLTSQWTMDDIVGVNIADELGPSDGTINGTVATITDGRDGDAIALDGNSSNYVDLGSLFSTGLAEMTLVFWFRQSSAGAGYLIAKYDEENDARCFYIHFDGTTTYTFGVFSDGAAYSAAQVATVTGSIYDDDLWHVCCCRFEANTVIEMRIDDGDWKQAATPSTMSDTAEPVLIGKCGSVAPAPGTFDIDNIKFFQSALSDDEIVQAQSRQ